MEDKPEGESVVGTGLEEVVGDDGCLGDETVRQKTDSQHPLPLPREVMPSVRTDAWTGGEKTGLERRGGLEFGPPEPSPAPIALMTYGATEAG